ncbi:MAG: family 78 glycoside hydrolase catalytic domain [Prevotella sp.]
MKKSLFIAVFTAACTMLPLSLWARSIEDLRTNYENNPFGIEENPVFSWRLEAGNSYGAAQKTYRITVAESEENLQNGIYVYDTGTVKSGNSVCIAYNGKPLEPCTRYYWQVEITDEKGKRHLSRTAYFETALMSLGWGAAEWIGSAKVPFSPYAGDAVIGFDVSLKPGSEKGVFVFAHTDKQNHATMELDFSRHPHIVFSHIEEGVSTTDTTVVLDSKQFLNEKGNNRHHISLTLRADEFKRYNAYLCIDGKRVNAETGNSAPFILNFKNPRERCRIYQIGFMQPEGQHAVFSNLVLRDRLYKHVLYADRKTYDLNGQTQTFFPGEGTSAPMLRKQFALSKTISKARLYATARGIYDMYLNGQRVADDFLNPGWTDYRFRFMYNTYDVTPLLKQGDNVVGAMLGTGWWTGYVGPSTDWQNQYGMRLSLLAKLVIEYEDGTSETIVSDPSWKCYDDGPVTSNAIYTGEDYDARKEVPGWATKDFDDHTWKPVTVYDPLPHNVTLQPYIGRSVAQDTVCTAKTVKEITPGTYIFDMGQNIVGVPHFTLKGKRGQTITIRFAEMCWPETIPTEPVPPYTIEMYEQNKGRMYLDNYRSALSTDHYTFRGDATGELIEPRFTFHGFRYVQIEGLEQCPDLASIQIKVLNSLPQGPDSHYDTSDPLINQLYSNILWGQRSNFLTIPTDCPQRDERLGWTGDAQIFSRTSTYNWLTEPLFRRWLNTFRDNQGPNGNYSDYCPSVAGMPGGGGIGYGARGWTEAGIIIPWQLYQQYGDRMILEQSYPSMKRYMDFVEANAKDFIQPIGGYGDWVALYGTQSDLTNTCYTGWDAQMMAQIAALLGHEDDAAHYRQLNENIKEAFNKRYVDEEGYMVAPAGSPKNTDSFSAAFGVGPKTTEPRRIESQTAYILPLQTNMLDKTMATKAAAHLAELVKKNDFCLNTGFIGTPYLNIVLSENGYDDIAYKLFQQTEYPSWLYPVVQGATTIWERWNSYTLKNGFGPVEMNSFNHYAYGAVMDWMMMYSAGIQRDEQHPGYKHFYLQPRVGGKFTHISASFKSMYGTIKSAWQSDNRKLTDETDAARYGYTYNATVPANTTATLLLPSGTTGNVTVVKGKQGIISRNANGQQISYLLAPGQYTFKVSLKK